MTDEDKGQIADGAADFYERFFVPALFEAFTAPVCNAAGLGAGDVVLDVACGTGVLTRQAATQVGASGRVEGLDLNPGMLAVAQARSQDIVYTHGDAVALPYPDNRFDATVSQFGLMFVPNKEKALAEMGRVTRPGGSVTVAVWHDLKHFEGYRVLAAIFDSALGTAAGDALRAPFAMGDPDALVRMASSAGLTDVSSTSVAGVARFPSIAEFVTIEIKGWVLADSVSDAQLSELIAQAEAALNHHTDRDGTFAFPSMAILLTAKAA